MLSSTGKCRVEVFDECEEEAGAGGVVSDRLSKVEAAGRGGGAMGGSTTVMPSSLDPET